MISNLAELAAIISAIIAVLTYIHIKQTPVKKKDHAKEIILQRKQPRPIQKQDSKKQTTAQKSSKNRYLDVIAQLLIFVALVPVMAYLVPRILIKIQNPELTKMHIDTIPAGFLGPAFVLTNPLWMKIKKIWFN